MVTILIRRHILLDPLGLFKGQREDGRRFGTRPVIDFMKQYHLSVYYGLSELSILKLPLWCP